MTRCKVGDMVLVIRSACGNEGRVGTVIEPLESFTLGGPAWLVAGEFRAIQLPEMKMLQSCKCAGFLDSALMPIPKDPIQDDAPDTAKQPELV